ncbi:hypothetical protein DMP17_22185 [Pseudonocardia sp. TMWB2A]|uniref:hypothetical protein n=1 Tax=Pseudonocardia sp. TMWB2A TaxID=687430 RepID=UPI00307F9560
MSDGLWERLQARALPTETVRFPADRAAADAANARLVDAAAAVQDSLRRGGPTEDQAAERDAAQAAVDDLAVQEWTVRALPPHEWELLVAEHPAQPGAAHGEDFDPGAFYPAMLAETVTAGGGETLTAAQWAQLFASGAGLTLGEKNTLINTALSLNLSAPVVSEHVGKGSGRTPP